MVRVSEIFQEDWTDSTHFVRRYRTVNYILTFTDVLPLFSIYGYYWHVLRSSIDYARWPVLIQI